MKILTVIGQETYVESESVKIHNEHDSTKVEVHVTEETGTKVLTFINVPCVIETK